MVILWAVLLNGNCRPDMMTDVLKHCLSCDADQSGGGLISELCAVVGERPIDVPTDLDKRGGTDRLLTHSGIGDR